ncbi:pyrimidodiazepine synthase isoform X1 [Drosophila kikkawai]|uniref:Pyrimidodiazepine synthase isoform X1 n=2 Tax=Drosophila kikkawai TaxID=30033 RepID=A0A6P4IS63_DROKI|nr:pyrimidodiazepine synthase isoform X1 [Drosophila kikkawai]
MSDTEHLTTGSPKPVFPDDGILKLYSMRFCPYAHRVHLVLDAKKIPYHSIYINLREKPEWFPQVSSSSKVPALELVAEPKNSVLIESLIICDYLDEKYPEVAPLYPKDPLKKAQEKILVVRFDQFINAFYKLVLHDNPASLGDTDLYAGLETYEEELKQRGTEFFGGTAPGMLDYMIWPWCERFSALKFSFGDHFDLSPERFGTLLKWRDLMLKDRAVKCFYLDGKIHAKYMASRRAGTADYNMLYHAAKRARLE